MSLKDVLIRRTVPIWPILGKTTAGVCSPGENLHPWGSSSPVSSEEQKPRTAFSPAPGERETAAGRGGQEPQLFLAGTRRGGEGGGWRKNPALPCALSTLCASQHLQQHLQSSLFSSAPLTDLGNWLLHDSVSPLPKYP